jgi:hypothetical protein
MDYGNDAMPPGQPNREFLQVDPATLRLPGSRGQGADPAKLVVRCRWSPPAMNPTLRADLWAVMTDLSRLYPEMRFGQLFEVLALLASDELPAEPYHIEDDDLLEAAVRHLESRLQQLGMKRAALSQQPLAAEQRELLEVLRDLHQRHPDWRLALVVARAAEGCAVGLYDVEDEELRRASDVVTGGCI